MRGTMKRAAPRVARFAWLASSIGAAVPAAAAAVTVAPAQDVVTSQPAATLSAADRSDAQRLLSTARIWGTNIATILRAMRCARGC